WAPRRLHISGVPRLRTYRAKQGGRVKGACAHLHVVRLQDDTALPCPVRLQSEEQVLECSRRFGRFSRTHAIFSRQETVSEQKLKAEAREYSVPHWSGPISKPSRGLAHGPLPPISARSV